MKRKERDGDRPEKERKRNRQETDHTCEAFLCCHVTVSLCSSITCEFCYSSPWLERPIAANELVVVEAMAHASFPALVVDIIGGYLPGLIIRPYGEDEVLTPHYNPAYCLLQRNFLDAFLRLRAVQRALVLPPAPHAFQQPAAVQWFPVDLDMCFCLLPTTRLPEDPMLDYHMLKHPILKILPERPQDLVQLCPHPLAVFAAIPPGHSNQGWKSLLCNAFWQAGAEQPMVTPPEHKALTTGTVKVPSRLFKFVLASVGVSEVYVGRYGMKDYLLPNPPAALAAYHDTQPAHILRCRYDGQARWYDLAFWLETQQQWYLDGPSKPHEMEGPPSHSEQPERSWGVRLRDSGRETNGSRSFRK